MYNIIELNNFKGDRWFHWLLVATGLANEVSVIGFQPLHSV